MDKKRLCWKVQKGVMMIGIAWGLIRVGWGGGLGGCGHNAKFNSIL